ncbi:MAG: hypothetical protein HY293_13005 [Planctomycetes bacterium]|nr:hypothetical protein [Planctomycetota bacterium]
MRLLLELLTALSCAGPEQDAKVDFEARVLPLLRERCFSCHEAAKTAPDGRVTKPKAGLRLDGRGWILKGSDERAVLVAGDPAKSRLYSLTALPADHEDRMPSKGAPLTKAQTESLRLWIAQGANFGTWVGAPGGKLPAPEAAAQPPPIVSERLTRLEALGRGVKPAAAADLERARKAGAIVQSVIPGSPLLAVSFVSREAATGDKELAELVPLAPQITRLDLGRTKVTDAGLKLVASCPALTWVDLHETAIGDAGLAALKGLLQLRTLNLYKTAVTDAGLASLENLGTLEDLYLRETKVSEGAISKLGEKLSQTEIHSGFENPTADPGAATARKKKKK